MSIKADYSHLHRYYSGIAVTHAHMRVQTQKLIYTDGKKVIWVIPHHILHKWASACVATHLTNHIYSMINHFYPNGRDLPLDAPTETLILPNWSLCEERPTLNENEKVHKSVNNQMRYRNQTVVLKECLCPTRLPLRGFLLSGLCKTMR